MTNAELMSAEYIHRCPYDPTADTAIANVWRAEKLKTQYGQLWCKGKPKAPARVVLDGVKVSDTVMRTPNVEWMTNAKPMKCTVVYVHPLGRYHTVEFRFKKGPVRESYFGTAIAEV